MSVDPGGSTKGSVFCCGTPPSQGTTQIRRAVHGKSACSAATYMATFRIKQFVSRDKRLRFSDAKVCTYFATKIPSVSTYQLKTGLAFNLVLIDVFGRVLGPQA